VGFFIKIVLLNPIDTTINHQPKIKNMKSTAIIKTIAFSLAILLASGAYAQDTKNTSGAQQKPIYVSLSAEMIFSFATIDNQGNEGGNIMRWAPVFNPQMMFNYDISHVFGLFTGLAVRNVGFIYKNPLDSNNTKFKFRTYNLGIPVGFKIGKMDKVMFFAGYEMEFPFVYKEKRFVNESKEDVDVIWFSDKVEHFQQSFMAGIQLPYGATIKFKYYFTNFHNRDYVAMVNGVATRPYDFKDNVFYFSLGWNVFSRLHDYDPKKR
jgi:hypothetical protein